ncbi:MAG: prolyl oligopeptidase family serine peptidase [Pseudomonadota bacterium]
MRARRSTRPWVLALALALSGCGGLPGQGEVVTIAARDAYDFADFARPVSPGEEPVTLSARLAMPDDGMALRGAAILSHGAAGPGGRQVRAAEALNRAGIATLIMDHFGGRGVRSVARDQIRVSEQTMLGDLVAARAVLAARLGLDPARIGVAGWSKGATTTLLAALERPFRFAAPQGPPFAFAVAFYPFCGFELDAEATAAPFLMLLGEDDDWTPSGPCARQAAAWAGRGAGAEAVVYPGARHGFDSVSGTRSVGQAITVRRGDARCVLTLGLDGVTRGLDRVHDIATPEARTAWLAECGVRGVSFGGDDAAREDALARMVRFATDALDRLP